MLAATAAVAVAGSALTVGLQAAIPDTPTAPGPTSSSDAPRHSASPARTAAPSGGDADDEDDREGRKVARVHVVANPQQAPVAASGGSG